MKTLFALTLGSILLSPLAFAQISPFSLEDRGSTLNITFLAPRGPLMPVVTGAPYSADQISEHIQTLSDGTHVTQPGNVQHFVRDSQGRTRTDRPLLFSREPTGWNLTVSEIRDPVAGFYYILDAQNKVAHRFAIASTRPMASPPAPAVALPQKTVSNHSRPETSSEKMGSQLIEGVMADGIRATTTWPVGAQGNDRPIVVTSESWFSQDLKTAVLTRNSDPRNGENTLKLTNISRAEPDPSLFQPPPDYSTVDEKGPFTITVARH